MLAELRRLARSVGEASRDKTLSTAGAHVTVRDFPGTCPVCGQDSWKVQKTTSRPCRTLAHGPFEAREIVFECGSGCHHPSGARVTHRSLSTQLVPKRGVGYDLMVFIGLQRFLHHRQREDICTMLQAEHGIPISTGEVSALAKLFANYLGRLHRKRSEKLMKALQSDGGWPMHADATGEDGRGTLFKVMAGWRRWTLGAWKLATERAELILPCIRETVLRFGPPCAVIRDLGRAVTLAVNDMISEFELEIPVLACHQHFLADVGDDLLDPVYGELRELFRRTKVRPKLRALVRDIGRKIGDKIEQARDEVIDWQQASGSTIPSGRAGMAAVRALAQWVLDYKAEATGLDYPFDRPLLDFYDRCTTARRALDAFLRGPLEDRKVTRILERLYRLFDPVISDVPFGHVTRRLRKRAKLFDELRETLRLAKADRGETQQDLDGMKDQLDSLVSSLHQRRPERGPAQDIREAIDLVLQHIEKHGEYLWGHEIALPPEAGGGTRLVARTNNLIESSFKNLKHGERRRSGRKILTNDLEHFPPEAALVPNLTHPDYVSILCGSLNELPAAFACLDREENERVQHGDPPSEEGETGAILQLASASLSTADRRVIRTKTMQQKVLDAARSRAPRRTSSRSSQRQATGS